MRKCSWSSLSNKLFDYSAVIYGARLPSVEKKILTNCSPFLLNKPLVNITEMAGEFFMQHALIKSLGKHGPVKTLLPLLHNGVNSMWLLWATMWIQTHKQQIITNLLRHFGLKMKLKLRLCALCSMKPSILCVLNDKVILPKRWRGLPKQTERGVVLPEARAACSALWRMLAATAPSSHCQHFLNGCIWDNNQTLINWLSCWRSAAGGDQNVEQQGRLARSQSSWPSWMLFHPSLWLIQNQLSHPNGPIAGCKLARFQRKKIGCREAWAVTKPQQIIQLSKWTRMDNIIQ